MPVNWQIWVRYISSINKVNYIINILLFVMLSKNRWSCGFVHRR